VLFLADRYLAFVPLATHAHQPVYRLLSSSKAFNPGNFATIVRYPKRSFRDVLIRALSSFDILPTTKNIEEFITMLCCV